MSEHIKGHSIFNQPYIYVLLGHLFMLFIERVLMSHQHSHGHHHDHSNKEHHKQKEEEKEENLHCEGKKISLVRII